jgi:predicted PurR-regulated permease PerM
MFQSSLTKYQKILTQLFVVFIAILSILILKPLFTPILSALMLSYLFYPVYKFILKKLDTEPSEKNKKISALLVLLIIILLILTPVLTLTIYFASNAKMVSQFVLLTTDKVTLIVNNQLPDAMNWINQNLGFYINLQPLIQNTSSTIFKKSQELLTQIPAFLLGIFITLFLVYYLLKNAQIAVEWFQHLLPLPQGKFKVIQKRFDALVRGIISSQLIIAVIQGILATIAFLILGLKNAIILGMLTTLLAVIPFLGAIVVWVGVFVSLLLGLSEGVPLWKPIFMFIYGVGLISIVDNIVRPKMLSDHSDIHPAIVLLGFIGGVMLFGLPGILLGPLILGLTDMAVEIYKETL